MKLHDELQAAQSKIAELSETIKTLGEKEVANAAAITTLTTERDEARAAVESAKVKLSEVEAANKALQENVSAISKARDEFSAQLDAATKKLALKQFDDIGGRAPLQDIGDGASASLTYEQAHSAYVKITDPKKAEEFRKAHAKALRLE